MDYDQLDRVLQDSSWDLEPEEKQYLISLQAAFPHLRIVIGTLSEYSEKGEVVIVPGVLKKMSVNPEERRKYENILLGIPRAEKILEEAHLAQGKAFETYGFIIHETGISWACHS